MRISDWSSDVCSSDLLVGKLGRLLRIGSRADDVPRSASGLIRWSESKGFKRTQAVGGPIKYVDGKGVVRVTIKRATLERQVGGTPMVSYGMHPVKGLNLQAIPFREVAPIITLQLNGTLIYHSIASTHFILRPLSSVDTDR